MPRYITPSPSTSRSRSRSRSCSQPQPTFKRGRSIDASYKRSRRNRSPSSSVSPSTTTREAKDKTLVKSSLAFLGAIGAASIIANKYWPKGALYGEKEEWASSSSSSSTPSPAKKKVMAATTTTTTTTTKPVPRRSIPDPRRSSGDAARRQKYEWDDGTTSESRRLSNVGRASFSEMSGDNYHAVSGPGSGRRGSHQRPRVYQDAAVRDGHTRRRSSMMAMDPTRRSSADLKYVETQGAGAHAVPRRYIVDASSEEAPAGRRSEARRYSVIER
ncbi:hypothetical protein F4810DRAFT_723303 [Camillea tinctor]|nr:hypothetical protein F4810DRAFT_723303 [Camillea tinctor]